VASFGIFLPFMIYGIILAGFNGVFRIFSNPEWLLMLFIIIYSGIHLLTWALVRYRLPVDSTGIIFAGFAFNDLYQRFWVRRKYIIKKAT
jgi:hypothetical protein